ncbi:MAG TPA: dihydropteroate synthase [Acidobacteriaceae bacterium]|jgi:dihydropteroate synthase
MHRRAHFDWKLRTRTLALGAATRVVGILNVTPDSFSDGGLLRSVDEAVEAGLKMFAEGAAMVDVGGESTRPGAGGVISTEQEIDRVVPVIEGIRRAQPDALLSIDTYRAPTARAAVAAGAEIVNDVSGLLWDDAMAAACVELQCGLILMHARGRPYEWKSLPRLTPGEVVPLVKRELAERLSAAAAAGIASQRIVLDPGFGFGKVQDANYPLLCGIPEIAALGQPVLAGVSRKSFLGHTLAPLYGAANAPVAAREHATLAASTIAILMGASLVRVHQVRPAVEAALIADATLAAG